MIRNKMNQRGQITIFIIFALILVVMIALIFVVRRGPPTEVIDEENPQAFIESCTKEAVEEALDILMPNGGDIIPEGSVMYNGNNITYLCYNANNYMPCINQRPLLVEHIEEEITKYIRPRVSNCFNILDEKLSGRYNIETSEMQLQTALTPKQIAINIDKKFKMTREDKVIGFDNFKINLAHPIYDIAEIAMEIANQEASFCNFDILGFMIFYPNWDIQKFKTGDSDTIYTINELTTNKEFKFAIRSCAMPGGF